MMNKEEAAQLAFQYMPSDGPPGRPNDWIVEAIQRAYEIGRNEERALNLAKQWAREKY